MARMCALTGKTLQFGHNVSNANNKTNRVFRGNIHKVTVFSAALNQWIPLKLSAHGMRCLDKVGGLDEWVLRSRSEKLYPELLRLKKRISKKESIKK